VSLNHVRITALTIGAGLLVAGVVVIALPDGGTTSVQSAQAATNHVTPAPGPVGSPGAQGLQGMRGLRGLRGLPGAAGAAAVPGRAGATGAAGASASPGAPGAVGAAGSPGNGGPVGLQGVAGSPGAHGIPGPQGAAGPQGVKGDTGAAGPSGASFVGGDCTLDPCVVVAADGGQLLIHPDCSTGLMGAAAQVSRLQSEDDIAGVQNRNVFYHEYVGDPALPQGQARHRTYGWWGDTSHGYADLFLLEWTDGGAQHTCSYTGIATAG